MSIKPQTCKYCVPVCKQTQQAFFEYEFITVVLNQTGEGGGDRLSVVFLHLDTGECRLASPVPRSKGKGEIASLKNASREREKLT